MRRESGSSSAPTVELSQARNVMNSKLKQLGARVVLLRAGAGRRGIPADNPGIRAGARRPVTPGTQWCSWIHIADGVELIISALDREQVRGPLNLTSPKTPVRNREFAEAFTSATSRPLRPPVPGRACASCSGRAESSSPRPTRASRPGTRARTRVPLTDADRHTRDLIGRPGDLSEEPARSSPGSPTPRRAVTVKPTNLRTHAPAPCPLRPKLGGQ